MLVRRALLLTFALWLVAAATACGGQSGPTAQQTTPGTTADESPSPTPGGDASSPASETTITQVNFAFSPATLSVDRGDTVTVKNGSPTTPHTFTVPGKIDETNDGRETQTVQIDLAPGTYQFICRFHVSAGMKGTLEVK